MISPLFYAVGVAVLMAGLLIEVAIFRALHDDPPATYKLFAVRDRLIRVVVDGKIDRHEPHFDALYRNVTILLRASRCLSGPDGWNLAKAQGKYFAHHPGAGEKLTSLPRQELPETLQPAVSELREALEYLIGHHFGIIVQIDSKRLEVAKIQKEQAKALLRMMPNTHCHA